MNPGQLASLRALLRQLPSLFLSGLLALLPVLITLGLILWLVDVTESIFGEALKLFVPEQAYGPGMGLLFGALVILGAGVLTQAIFFHHIVRWFEEALARIPLINTVYGAVRDLTALFSKKDASSQFSRPVLVQLPNIPMQLLGFITVESFDGLPFCPGEDVVAVYLPMSYQIGGYTTFVPRSCLTAVDMSFEDAMRFVVTAGMSRSKRADGAGRNGG